MTDFQTTLYNTCIMISYCLYLKMFIFHKTLQKLLKFFILTWVSINRIHNNRYYLQHVPMI